MKKHLLLLFLALSGFQGYGQISEYDERLNLPQSQFDSDTCCWRKLSQQGNHAAAAQLLIDYLNNSQKIRNTHSLKWHAGQMLAMSGNDEQAKKYFRKTYWIGYRWFGGEDGRAWYDYARGTIAFIDKDKRKLEKILHKWENRGAEGANYKALLRLLGNWGKPYVEAY